MKRISFLLWCLLVVVAACSSDDDGGSEGMPSSIRLTLSRSSIIADGTDATTFKVIDDQGTEITSECFFYVNDEEWKGTSFSTSVAGEYEIKALYGEIWSNTRKVKAQEPEDLTTTLSADKTEAVGDGKDLIVLILKNEMGDDVTDGGEFYLDGERLDEPYVYPEAGKSYTVTATYGGQAATNEITVSGVASKPFAGRMLLEMWTASWCTNCPKTKDDIAEASKPFPERVVSIMYHLNGSKGETDPFDRNQGHARRTAYDYDKLGIPRVCLNQVAMWDRAQSFDKFIEETTPYGMTISSEQISQTSLSVSAQIYSSENRTVNCSAVLIENNLIYGQYDGSGNWIEEYLHESVFRDASPAYGKDDNGNVTGQVWGEPLELSAGAPVEKNFELEIKSEYNLANCEVVIVLSDPDTHEVLNCHKVRAGRKVGY